jgi:hypothetical protein
MKMYYAIIFLVFAILYPGVGYGQAKKKITIMKTEDTKYFRGYLLGMTDSVLFMSEEKRGRDTVRVSYKSIYKIKPGRPPGKGIIIGAAAGTLIGATIGGMMDLTNEMSNTTATILTLGRYEGEQTNYAGTGLLIGMLAGGMSGLLIDLASQKDPIPILYSKDTFLEIQPRLRQYLPDQKPRPIR